MPSAVISPQRGHPYWAEMPYLPQRPLDIVGRGPEREIQAALTFKVRPVLVVQNKRDNLQLAYPFVIVAAVHSLKAGELEKLQRANYPTDFLLGATEGGLKRASVVFLNQLQTIHKNLLREHIGSLSDTRVAELNVKLTVALGLVEL